VPLGGRLCHVWEGPCTTTCWSASAPPRARNGIAAGTRAAPFAAPAPGGVAQAAMVTTSITSAQLLDSKSRPMPWTAITDEGLGALPPPRPHVWIAVSSVATVALAWALTSVAHASPPRNLMFTSG